MDQKGLLTPQMTDDKVENLAKALLYQERKVVRNNRRKSKMRRDKHCSRQRQEKSTGVRPSTGELQQRQYYNVQPTFIGELLGMEGMQPQSHFEIPDAGYSGPQVTGQQPQYHHQAQSMQQKSQYHYQAQEPVFFPPLGQEDPVPTADQLQRAEEDEQVEQVEQDTETAQQQPQREVWTKDNDDVLRWMVSQGKHELSGCTPQ